MLDGHIKLLCDNDSQKEDAVYRWLRYVQTRCPNDSPPHLILQSGAATGKSFFQRMATKLVGGECMHASPHTSRMLLNTEVDTRLIACTEDCLTHRTLERLLNQHTVPVLVTTQQTVPRFIATNSNVVVISNQIIQPPGAHYFTQLNAAVQSPVAIQQLRNRSLFLSSPRARLVLVFCALRAKVWAMRTCSRLQQEYSATGIRGVRIVQAYDSWDW